jgi:hypothetical protein
MITPRTPPPAPWPPKTISRREDDERLDRALADLVEDQWATNFIKRLNYPNKQIGHRK